MLRFAVGLGTHELLADRIVQVEAETRQHHPVDECDPTVDVGDDREEVERIEHSTEPVLGLLPMLLRLDHLGDVSQDRQVPPRNEVRRRVVVAHDHFAITAPNANPAAFASGAHEGRPMIVENFIFLDHVGGDVAPDEVVAIDAEHADHRRIGIDIDAIVVSDEHAVSSALEKCPVAGVLVVHNYSRAVVRRASACHWPASVDHRSNLVRRSCGVTSS